MSKILISGCGLSWSMQERPVWTKVIKLCGVDIDDQAGPAISNQMILNNMIESVMENEYDQAVCQLTRTGKLDIELTNDKRKEVMEKDTIRNFMYKNYWPSSLSDEHESKKLYYEYLHSPSLEHNDIIYKWLLLQRLCADKGVTLHTLFGYKINWTNKRCTMITADHDYDINNDYKNGDYYKHHDHSVGEKNTVPNKYFQIYLAKKINNEMLKLPIREKLERFHD